MYNEPTIFLALVAAMVALWSAWYMGGKRSNSEIREWYKELSQSQQRFSASMQKRAELLDARVTDLSRRLLKTEHVIYIAMSYTGVVRSLALLSDADVPPVPLILREWLNDQDSVEFLDREAMVTLVDMIERHFEMDELDDLVFKLGVESAVSGDNRRQKAKSVVTFFARRQQLSLLIGEARAARPDVAGWPLP